MCLHIAGASLQKGTAAVLEAWRRRPDWPHLVVIGNPCCRFGYHLAGAEAGHLAARASNLLAVPERPPCWLVRHSAYRSTVRWHIPSSRPRTTKWRRPKISLGECDFSGTDEDADGGEERRCCRALRWRRRRGKVLARDRRAPMGFGGDARRPWLRRLPKSQRRNAIQMWTLTGGFQEVRRPIIVSACASYCANLNVR
jgi:hypothetical protein